MSRSPNRSIALALTLCAGVGTLSTAGSNARAADPRVPAPSLIKQAPREPEPASPARIGLRIDTKALGSDAEPIAAKVEERGKILFDEEGVLEPLYDQDPVIAIVVERVQNSEDPGYVIGLSIEQGEDVIQGSARQSDCALCARTELIDKIAAELPKLIELARTVQVVREVDTGDDTGNDTSDDSGGDEGGEPRVKPIGPLGFAGIGLGVLGLGGVGAGVALALQEDRPLPDGGKYFKDYQTPGYVLLGVGGAALIAGVVLIALDVSKRKNQRKPQESRAHVQWIGTGLAF